MVKNYTSSSRMNMISNAVASHLMSRPIWNSDGVAFAAASLAVSVFSTAFAVMTIVAAAEPSP